ncbi:MAG: YdcF family protein [Lachnospiraceae bacterium]|nr:YdcF family protein [Lachnospiraceae bacterium]
MKRGIAMNKRIINEISDFIFMEDRLERADAILIPGGSHPELPELAAQLWKNGYADNVVATGAYAITHGKFDGVKIRQELYDGDYETECDFYCDVLKKNGVPENVIIREDKSQFTAQNAWFAKERLEERGIFLKKAIICCKAFHSRRCLMYFQFTFPDTEFMIAPAKDTHGGKIQKDNWFMSDIGMEKVLGELSRIGTQFVPEFTRLKEQYSDMKDLH